MSGWKATAGTGARLIDGTGVGALGVIEGGRDTAAEVLGEATLGLAKLGGAALADGELLPAALVAGEPEAAAEALSAALGLVLATGAAGFCCAAAGGTDTTVITLVPGARSTTFVTDPNSSSHNHTAAPRQQIPTTPMMLPASRSRFGHSRPIGHKAAATKISPPSPRIVGKTVSIASSWV